MTITFVITTVVMWALLAIALKKGRGSLKEHMPIITQYSGVQLRTLVGYLRQLQ
jgi:hypothetical protein